MGSHPSIDTPRLQLVLLGPVVVQALIQRDTRRASSALGGLTLPDHFLADDDFFLRIQLQRMEESPEEIDWCVRAMVRAVDSAVIGDCGFHGPPAAVGRAEIGYKVLPAYRSHGYATEAARGLVEFARARGQPSVFASVSPNNQPSLRVLQKLGFRQVGEQVDEIDGLELVFELALAGAG